MTAYYNEFKPEPVAMLRQLIKDGLIASGDVDSRSITEVKADDIKGYTQCHFFAGIGGWSVALRQAGWEDDRPVWTGSCPCQPFSVIGEKRGGKDHRHLWPFLSKLISERRPAIVFGEQVASAIHHGWLDGVQSDMEEQGYAFGSAVLPAGAVDAPHKRDRCWFVADSEERERLQGKEIDTFQHGRKTREINSGADWLNNGALELSCSERSQGQLRNESGSEGREEQTRYASSAGFWSDYQWITCADGKARRIPTVASGIRIVGYGLQYRAPLFHALGNAIVPEVATRFIKAAM